MASVSPEFLREQNEWLTSRVYQLENALDDERERFILFANEAADQVDSRDLAICKMREEIETVTARLIDCEVDLKRARKKQASLVLASKKRQKTTNKNFLTVAAVSCFAGVIGSFAIRAFLNRHR